MFTGIVQSQACVYSVKNENDLSRLVLKINESFVQELTLGASIAVNGVCLTVVEWDIDNGNAYISFDVIAETLKVSNLAQLSVNDMVNVERSLRFGDEIGGHIVSGHVHAMATLCLREETSSNCTLVFDIAANWQKYILPKGFISINGISLTVGEVCNSGFNVHLIPETLMRTNLKGLELGDPVNIECDQQTITIVDTIERIKL